MVEARTTAQQNLLLQQQQQQRFKGPVQQQPQEKYRDEDWYALSHSSRRIDQRMGRERFQAIQQQLASKLPSGIETVKRRPMWQGGGAQLLAEQQRAEIDMSHIKVSDKREFWERYTHGGKADDSLARKYEAGESGGISGIVNPAPFANSIPPAPAAMPQGFTLKKWRSGGGVGGGGIGAGIGLGGISGGGGGLLAPEQRDQFANLGKQEAELATSKQEAVSTSASVFDDPGFIPLTWQYARDKIRCFKDCKDVENHRSVWENCTGYLRGDKSGQLFFGDQLYRFLPNASIDPSPIDIHNVKKTLAQKLQVWCKDHVNEGKKLRKKIPGIATGKEAPASSYQRISGG